MLKFIIMALISISFVSAQDRTPVENDVEKFAEAVKKVENDPKLSSMNRVIDEAIRSGRVEFMKQCFLSFGDSSAFKDKLSALPPSTFKNKVILSIMQEPWTYDDNRSGSRPYPAMHRICIEVIKNYLPTENLSSDDEADVARLDRYSRRLVVAKRFRAALEAAGEIEPVSRPERKPPPTEKGSETDPAHPSMPNDSPGGRANPKMPLEKKIPSLIAAAAAIGFLIWMVTRKFFRAENI